MRRFLLVGALAALEACNSHDTLTPSQPSLSLPVVQASLTVYTGSITDSVYGAGSVTISVSSDGSSTAGTWTEAYPTWKPGLRDIHGTLTGTAYTATVSDCLVTYGEYCYPDCRQTFTGTLTSTGFTGNYAELPGDHCATVRSGSVNASSR